MALWYPSWLHHMCPWLLVNMSSVVSSHRNMTVVSPCISHAGNRWGWWRYLSLSLHGRAGGPILTRLMQPAARAPAAAPVWLLMISLEIWKDFCWMPECVISTLIIGYVLVLLNPAVQTEVMLNTCVAKYSWCCWSPKNISWVWFKVDI